MPHNLNRRPDYPLETQRIKSRKRIPFKCIFRGILRWMPLWVPIVFLIGLLTPQFMDDYRLGCSHTLTTAHVKRVYKGTGRNRAKMVEYYFCVGNEWYQGRTSPPDSIWDNLQPHDPFEIVYETDNPSNSNWAGYYKE